MGKRRTVRSHTVFIIGFLNLDLVISITAQNQSPIVIKINVIIMNFSIMLVLYCL